jgi:hypothetical protein
MWEMFQALLVSLDVDRALTMIVALPDGAALAAQVRWMLDARDRTTVRVRLKYMGGDRGPVAWTREWIVRPMQIEHVPGVAINMLARDLKLDGLGSPIVLLAEVIELRPEPRS